MMSINEVIGLITLEPEQWNHKIYKDVIYLKNYGKFVIKNKTKFINCLPESSQELYRIYKNANRENYLLDKQYKEKIAN